MNGIINQKDEKQPLISETHLPSEESKASPKPTRLITVEPALVSFFVAVTAGNPINQQYIYARFAEDFNYTASTENSTRCGTTEGVQDVDPLSTKVQAMASMWAIILIATDLLPSLVTTVVLGAYSDKAGRKKAMIPPAVGLTIRGLVSLMVVSFHLPIPVMLLVH